MRTEPYAPVTVLEEADEALAPRVPDALRHLKEEIAAGRPWHEALLEAMGMWTLPQERWRGRDYQYVIQGEAFDWLLLAERMCLTLKGQAPSEEVEDLLFKGQLPTETSPQELRAALGYNKYRGLLNFWYGVVVEQALLLAVEDEVRKEFRASGRTDVEDMSEVAYRRVYDEDCSSLMERFWADMGSAPRTEFTVTQAKEFSYWLFKHRLKYWDPARVASDTRKGLWCLEMLRGSSGPV